MSNHLTAYTREHIDSCMYYARRVGGTARRNAAHEARAWNKLLVRELRRERARRELAQKEPA